VFATIQTCGARTSAQKSSLAFVVQPVDRKFFLLLAPCVTRPQGLTAANCRPGMEDILATGINPSMKLT
jgi:hypothetical protein